MDEKINSIQFQNAILKGDLLTDHQAMALAIQEAYKGAPFVSPNPLVGCVILDAQNKFLASGYHTKFGEPHAEVEAFKKLTPEDLNQAQFFVTLEPCAHEGKTPSCAKALAQMRLKKVVYGLQDPNPLVAGQGAKIILDANIKCELYQGLLTSDLEDLAEVFLKNFTQKKIFVAAKVAQSLDGQIALKTGESQWITSEASREYVHELRSWYDAVLVGRNTIKIDNPTLNIRHSLINKENYLIIIDPEAKILAEIAAGKKFKFQDGRSSEKIIFATRAAVKKSNFKNIVFNDLTDLLQKLWNLSIRSVFIEGGATTYSKFLQAQLIDRLHVFTAPVIIGNQNGQSWTKDFSIHKLDEKLKLSHVKSKQFGSDQYLTGRL